MLSPPTYHFKNESKNNDDILELCFLIGTNLRFCEEEKRKRNVNLQLSHLW